MLVEVGDKRLLEDEVRIINRVGGSYWQADAKEKADTLAERLGAGRSRTARALKKRSKEPNFCLIISIVLMIS